MIRPHFRLGLQSARLIRTETPRRSTTVMSAIPRDVLEFLNDYPTIGDGSSSANLEFYSNRRRCRPDNLLIEEIHERWRGDYAKLEYKHGFIQWLFPIQEHGMNFESKPLQRHEITEMKADDKIVARVLDSYQLMLDFYGMKLDSAETGQLSRADVERKQIEQYKNLSLSSHNYLRISRILKCLSELGLERLNAGFLLHVLNEQSEHGQLNNSTLRGSMDRWWANCLRNEREREWIRGMIVRVREEEGFVFTRQMYEQALERRKSTGKLESS